MVTADGFDAALITADRAELPELALLPAGSRAEMIEVSGDAPPASPGAASLDRDGYRISPAAATTWCARSTRCPAWYREPAWPTGFTAW